MSPFSPASIHAVCPACRREIRVPAARVADRPRCPACKSLVFDGRPVVLDDASFDAFLGRTNLPLLLDVWAPWCGPCLGFAPVIADAAREYAGRIVVAKLDSDASPGAASRLKVRSIPTLVLFQDGRELARQAGAVSAAALRSWVSSRLVTPN